MNLCHINVSGKSARVKHIGTFLSLYLPEELLVYKYV